MAHARSALNPNPQVTALGVPLALGSVVGISTLPPILKWYLKLRKPKWTPPAPVFGQARAPRGRARGRRASRRAAGQAPGAAGRVPVASEGTPP